MKTEWFTRWFGREYLDLYPHRNDAEARAAVALVRRVSGATTPARALDLACGSGRHTRALAEWLPAVGFDLSATLLRVARSESPALPFVRGDMRSLPFARGAFDLVVNLFTSFGYFATDAEHRRVLREVCRVTRPGGTFVLDYLNAPQVRARLVPRDRRRVNGRMVTQRRRIADAGRYVEKEISADGCAHTYLERVRLFTPSDLRQLLEENGFVVCDAFGDYTGTSLTAASPRVILFARRH